MDIVVIKAWIGRQLNNPVIKFRVGSTVFSYIGTANDHPLIRQQVGGDKVREHRRELKWSDPRYIDIKRDIEDMIASNEIPFGPPPAI